MQLGQTRFYRYLGIGLFGIFCIVPFQNCRQGSTEGDLILVGPFYTNELDLFRLDRTGGGDFGYEIVDSGSFYTVQLNHFQYKAYSTNDKTFIVEKKANKGSWIFFKDDAKYTSMTPIHLAPIV